MRKLSLPEPWETLDYNIPPENIGFRKESWNHISILLNCRFTDDSGDQIWLFDVEFSGTEKQQNKAWASFEKALTKRPLLYMVYDLNTGNLYLHNTTISTRKDAIGDNVLIGEFIHVGNEAIDMVKDCKDVYYAFDDMLKLKYWEAT